MNITENLLIYKAFGRFSSFGGEILILLFAKQATACQAGNSVPSRQQRAKQTTACQADNSVPSRIQCANQATERSCCAKARQQYSQAGYSMEIRLREYQTTKD